MKGGLKNKMETKQKRIQELEEELNRKLLDFGASYQLFTSTLRGNKKLRGRHLRVSFPSKVKINVKEIVALFNEYYAEIKKVSRIESSTCGLSGIRRNYINLDLE